jgi:hypothetical protein
MGFDPLRKTSFEKQNLLLLRRVLKLLATLNMIIGEINIITTTKHNHINPTLIIAFAQPHPNFYPHTSRNPIPKAKINTWEVGSHCSSTVVIRGESISKIGFSKIQISCIIIENRMHQAWGFANEGRKMATDQKAEKKKEAFWEVANDNVIIVPDIDAETEAIQQDVSKPMGLEVEKLVDFYDMQIETRKSTLPAPEEGVDLSLLLSMIRTG